MNILLTNFSEVEYRCVFIYFDVVKNTFLFDATTDNKIFKELAKMDINCPSYKTDVFLYYSLLDSIIDLHNRKYIILHLFVKK